VDCMVWKCVRDVGVGILCVCLGVWYVVNMVFVRWVFVWCV